MATGREEISSLMGEEVQTLKKAVGSGDVRRYGDGQCRPFWVSGSASLGRRTPSLYYSPLAHMPVPFILTCIIFCLLHLMLAYRLALSMWKQLHQ